MKRSSAWPKLENALPDSTRLSRIHIIENVTNASVHPAQRQTAPVPTRKEIGRNESAIMVWGSIWWWQAASISFFPIKDEGKMELCFSPLLETKERCTFRKKIGKWNYDEHYAKQEANGRAQSDSYLSACLHPKMIGTTHRRWALNPTTQPYVSAAMNYIGKSEMPHRWWETPDPQRMSWPRQKMATKITSSKIWPWMGKQIKLLQ